MTDWNAELKSRLAGLTVRPEREADILDELAQHLDDEVRMRVGGGMDPGAARLEALSELDAPGELARRLIECETRPPLALPPPGAPARGRWFTARVSDVRYSIRTLRRSPAFALTVIITLALTIGPTTAILSVGNWLVWRPVPGVRDQGQLVEAQTGQWKDKNTGDGTIVSVSYLNLRDLREAGQTFVGLAGVQESNAHLAGDAIPPTDATVSWVTADAFDVLGVPFVAGRSFLPEEDAGPSGSPVMVVNEDLAERAFGSASGAIGQRLTLNGLPMTVVGVVASRFHGLTPTSFVDVWYPVSTYAYVNRFSDPSRFINRGGGLLSSFVIRLAPGKTMQALQAELDVLLPALAERYPDENKDFRAVSARLRPGLGSAYRDRSASMVSTLVTIGAVLLVLGCANVANVLMLRAVRTARERAIRLALGASRARLVALQLTESAVLAVTGALAGVALALWLKQLIATLLFPGVPEDFDFGPPLDLTVLAMTLGVSVACGLLAGFVPALLNRGVALHPAVTAAGGRSVTIGRRLRGVLAGAQLALSLALVTGSLLLVATMQRLHAVDLGFDPTGVSQHLVNPRRQGYPAVRAAAYFSDLQARLTGRSGFDVVSLAGLTPFGSSFRMRVQDSSGPDRPPLSVNANNVDSRYFDALRIKIVRGRAFTEAEARLDETVDYPVIIDQSLARRLFGDSDPIGRLVVIPAAGRSTLRRAPVVGVAADTHWNSIVGDQLPFIYTPLATIQGASVALVRSRLPMRAVTETVRAAAREIDPTLPVRLSMPVENLIDRRLAQQRVFFWMLSLLGWIAFALAAVGLYGLLAQSVTERTREFGVRMALGSGRGRIFALVLRYAAWIAGLGGLAGLGLAAWGTRLIETQLYGVTRLDPMIYAAATLALIVIVFATAIWPARSATRIQPIDALRTD